MLNVLAAIFDQHGYWVHTASEPFAALAMIRDCVPDVLLSDLHIPGMSGFELLSIVRRRFPSVAVIAMSGKYAGVAVPPDATTCCSRRHRRGPQAHGRIVYRFHARDLNLVMGPTTRGSSVRFRLLIDGQPPGAAHGADTDSQGSGRVTQPGLYQLIRQPRPIVERTFEIEFLDAGVAAYDFTFG